MTEIEAVLKEKPNNVGFEQRNWTAELLRQWIEKRFGKKMVKMTANRIMHRLGYSKTRAKKQNRDVDLELVEAFRETVDKMVENKDENTVILYEDETIISSKPSATSVWTKRQSSDSANDWRKPKKTSDIRSGKPRERRLDHSVV